MSETDWHALYKSLAILTRSGETLLGPPPQSSLDAFERENGISLPVSYRRMISVFGPGELGGRFSIKAPGYADRRPRADLRSFTEEWRAILPENYSDPRVGRMVFFCDTLWSDFIGWDPTDVRDPRTHEYGIYICVHERESCDFLTDSFDQFVNNLCLGDGFARFLGIDLVDFDAPTRTFQPASV